MRVNRKVPRMHDAGSLAAVVAGELGVVVEVVDLDFELFELESSEHATTTALASSRAISGMVRRGRRRIRCSSVVRSRGA